MTGTRFRLPGIRAGAVAFVVALVCAWIDPAPAQDESMEATLADIRQELGFLLGEVQYLKSQLVTTGPPQSGSARRGGTVALRVDAIESELRQLTGAVEELQFRVETIVEDGTRRIGDLEFRLVELEGGDLSSVGMVPTLGTADPETAKDGEIEAVAADDSGEAAGNGKAANVAEAAAAQEPVYPGETPFEVAMAAFEAGNYADALGYLDTALEPDAEAETFAEVRFWQGESHFALQDWQSAASSYLDSFSSSPKGPNASGAILGLGISLGELGHADEACLMLSEAAVRAPDDPEVAGRAERERVRFGCN